MNYLKNLFLFTIVITFIFSSCGKEATPLCTSADFTERFTNAANSFVQAQNDYLTDPENSQKCEAFKSSYINYINELRALSECAVFLGRAEFQNDLDDAEDDFDDFEC